MFIDKFINKYMLHYTFQ